MAQNVIDGKGLFGERLRAARLEHQPRITIAAIARELEVDPRTVARWQSGDSVPPFDRLVQLAALLGKRPSYFLDAEAA